MHQTEFPNSRRGLAKGSQWPQVALQPTPCQGHNQPGQHCRLSICFILLEFTESDTCLLILVYTRIKRLQPTPCQGHFQPTHKGED